MQRRHAAPERADPDAAPTVASSSGTTPTGGDDEPTQVSWALLLGLVLLPIVAPVALSALGAPAPAGRAVDEAIYAVDVSALQQLADTSADYSSAAAQLAAAFVPLARDDSTDSFLEWCANGTATWAQRVALSGRYQASLLMQILLGWSHTDAMASIGHISLFAASTAQLRHITVVDGTSASLTLLDIGAGSGSVTQAVAVAIGALPEQITAMEASRPHLQSLAGLGYRSVASFDELPPPPSPGAGGPGAFDAVVLFHVMDRCDNPAALLVAAAERVAPGGLLIIATTLPFCPKVWAGKLGRLMASRQPLGALTLHADASCDASPQPSFEVSAAAFAAGALGPLTEPEQGWQLEMVAWTRLPYISSAVKVSHYALDSALFVLRRG